MCILYRLFCLKTPEQNGLAEKKHPHIVERVLTLLFHAYVPNYL